MTPACGATAPAPNTKRADLDPEQAERRRAGASLTDGGVASIVRSAFRAIPNPDALGLSLNFVRTNTIFGVVHRAADTPRGPTSILPTPQWQARAATASMIISRRRSTLWSFRYQAFTTPACLLPTVPDPLTQRWTTASRTSSATRHQSRCDSERNRRKNHYRHRTHPRPQPLGMNFQAVTWARS